LEERRGGGKRREVWNLLGDREMRGGGAGREGWDMGRKKMGKVEEVLPPLYRPSG